MLTASLFSQWHDIYDERDHAEKMFRGHTNGIKHGLNSLGIKDE